jgi:hypothetical protein
MCLRVSRILILGLCLGPLCLTNTVAADLVVLKNGDRLVGTVISNTEGVVTFDHPDLGRLNLPTSSLASIAVGPIPPLDASAPGAGPAAPAAPEAAKEAEPAAPPAEPVAPRKTGEWDVHLAFALAGNFAVNDEITLRAGAGAERETERSKTTLSGEYYYRVFDDVTTDNNLLLKALQEWTIDESPWLFFTQGQYQYDEFQPWTHRISGYVGPGYRVLDTDTLRLTVRAGAGATYEAGDVHRWKPEALLAEEFRWTISRRQTIALDSSIAPNVEDFSDYRVQTSLEYRLLIDESKRGLSLTAGLRDIYLSKPADQGKANELRVYAGLRYDF